MWSELCCHCCVRCVQWQESTATTPPSEPMLARGDQTVTRLLTEDVHSGTVEESTTIVHIINNNMNKCDEVCY